MSKIVASRLRFEIAKTYGPSVAMTAITNAAQAVATLASGHNVVVGDYLEVSSGWFYLDRRIVRVSDVTGDAVTLEGLRTSRLSLYPAGEGIGAVRRITDWERLSQMDDVSVSGGEQQYDDATELEAFFEEQEPTIRSAYRMQLTFFDDPSLPWLETVEEASESGIPTAVRMVTVGGAKIVANARWALGALPSIQKNRVLRNTIDLSFKGLPTRYAN